MSSSFHEWLEAIEIREMSDRDDPRMDPIRQPHLFHELSNENILPSQR